jgi:hypothetical protein
LSRFTSLQKRIYYMLKSIFLLVFLSLFAFVLHAQNKQITRAEYFWNTDPGQGNATALVAEDGNFSTAIELILGNSLTLPATVGLHKLGVRVLEVGGTWSPVFSTVIEVRQNLTARDVRVSQAEFFWNTDPGQGNATPLLAFDGNFDGAFEQAFQNTIALPAAIGLHTLGVRVRSIDGGWSSVFSTVIEVRQNLTARDVRVSQAEFYWDTDPGQGNATPLLAFDGNLNAAFENLVSGSYQIPTSLSIGLHRLYTRVRSIDGGWSSPFVYVIDIEASNLPILDTITGGQVLCATGTITGRPYNVNFQNNYTYTWTTSNGTIAAGQSTNSVTVNFTTAGTHQIQVIACNGFGCDTATTQVNITAPPAVATISGNSSFCAGSNTVLQSSAAPNGYSYQWQLNGNNIAGANAQSYTANTAGNYTLIFAGACPSNSSNTLAISVQSAPSAPSISGGGSTCLSSSALSVASAPSNYGYQWYLNGNPISGANAQTYSATTSGNYTANYTGTCPSALSSSTVVALNASGPAAANISSNSTVLCNGTSATLQANTAPSGYGYQWRLNGNNIAGANAQSYTANTAGNYTLVFTGVCPVSPSNTIALTTANSPAAPTATNSGNNSFCAGSNTVLQSSAAPNGYSYQWQLNGNNIAGAISQNYTASSAGNYTLIFTGACPSNSSNTLAISVQNAPSAPSITGGGSTCLPTSTLSVASAPSNYGYQWYLNGNPISGANAQTYSATTSGNYTANYTGTCPSALSTPRTTTINTPLIPVISYDANLNVVEVNSPIPSQINDYQWYFNNVIVPAANADFILPTANGNYFVEITDINGCVSRSNTVQTGTVSITTQSADNLGFSLFPNPTESAFVLENNGATQPLKLEIINVLGQVLLTLDLPAQQAYPLDLPYPSGAYFLRLSNTAGQQKTLRIIKS